MIGGDTAGDSGTAWSDYFAAHVLDNTTGEQVAVLHGKMDEDVFARQIYCLGMYYNEALVGVEVNYSTHPVKELQRLNYPRQYTREQTDTYTGALKKAYGFNTNTATRRLSLRSWWKWLGINWRTSWMMPHLLKCSVSQRTKKDAQRHCPGSMTTWSFHLAIANHIRPQQSVVVKKEPVQPRKKLIDILKEKDRRAIRSVW